MISQLNQRERIFVFAGGGILSLVLLYFAILMPYTNAMARLDSQVEGRLRQLQEVQNLKADYLAVKQQSAQMGQRLDKRNFSVLPFLENLIEQTAGRANLLSMRPQAPVNRDQFILDSVEIKLEKMTLKQILELLWNIEKGTTPMQVSNLYLKQRFDDQSLLDATIMVSSLRDAS